MLSPETDIIKFMHFKNKEGQSIFCCSISEDLYRNILSKSIFVEIEEGYLDLKGGKDND